MVSTEKIGSSVSYSYDDFGRRIKKDVGGTITKYLYDGSQCVLETDGSDITTARYIYGSRIDEPIIMIRDGNTYYYHFDGLGNVVDITNSLGVTVESYTYDVFGKVSIENPHVNPPIPNPNPHIPPRNPRIPPPPQSTGNPYFFTGRRLDTETGLYYYRARYYDPGMGRFLTTDPVGYREGMNLYTYVRNNPVKYVDPFGLGASGGGGDDDELYSFNWEEFKKLQEKFWKNWSEVEAELYGSDLEIADALGLWGLANLGIYISASGYTALTDTLAVQQINGARVAGAFTKGSIASKIVGAQKGATTAARTTALRGAMGTVSKVSMAGGALATGYSLGARINIAVRAAFRTFR